MTEVDVGLDREVGVPDRAGVFPRLEVGRIGRADDKFVRHVVVAAHGDIILGWAAEVIGEEMFFQQFTAIVLTPVDAVEVEMDEAPVGIKTAHVEHGIFDESPGHIKAALVHVLRAGPEIEFVKGGFGEYAAIEPVEEGDAELGGAVAGAAFHADAAFGVFGPGIAEAGDAAVDLHGVAGAGPEHFEGAFLFLVFGLARQADRNRGQREEARPHAGRVSRVLRDRGIHDR